MALESHGCGWTWGIYIYIYIHIHIYIHGYMVYPQFTDIFMGKMMRADIFWRTLFRTTWYRYKFPLQVGFNNYLPRSSSSLFMSGYIPTYFDVFCWLVVWSMFFPYIGNFITPITELIFFRGVGTPPTSCILLGNPVLPLDFMNRSYMNRYCIKYN